jgi:hypothetical protein
LILLAAPLRADDAADAATAMQEALAAEVSLDFPRALAGYERSLRLRPSASFSVKARVRADDLRAHAEGNFAPLARLETTRRSARALADPVALDALLEEARAFPPGKVRSEAFLLVAEAFGRRLQRPDRAQVAARALLDDPAAEATLKGQALPLLLDALAAAGDAAGERGALSRYGYLSPPLVARQSVVDRRGRLIRGAQGVFGGVLVADLAALFLRRSRVTMRLLRAPASLGLALVVALGGSLFAWLFDPSLSLRPFGLLGAGILLVDRSVALWVMALGGGRWARGGALVAGLVAIAAVTLLSLLWSDPALLESFGL